MPNRDAHPERDTSVTCREHCGEQGLTEQQYFYQMFNADRLWFCPICGGFAEWNDERYERNIPDEPHNFTTDNCGCDDCQMRDEWEQNEIPAPEPEDSDESKARAAELQRRYKMIDEMPDFLTDLPF